MSEANRESLGFIAESTFGTNPGGTKQLLNFTSTTLGMSSDTTQSNFIRADTNRAGTIRTGVNPGGNIGIELQYGGYDSFFEAVLRGAFATALSASAVTISAASADNSFNGSGGSEFTNAVVGQWVRVAGFATAANNGYFRVTSKPTNAKIIVAGGTLVNESAGPAVTVKGSLLANGTTQKSFTIERHFQDISKYILLAGQRVSEVALNFNTADIAGGSISFLGANVAAASGSSGFSGSTAAATTQSMNTVNHIKKIFIDNVVSSADFTSLDLTISTNAEAVRRLGSLTAANVRQGSIGVSGNIGVYFEDTTFLDKNYNFTSLDMALVIEDDAGNAYVFHLPEAHLLSGNPDNQGIDTTITENYSFAAVLDPTLLTTMSITRIPA